MVSFTFSRLLCGSVQTNVASISFTLARFFSFFRQSAISSRDSRAQLTHCWGGLRYLSQFLQKWIVTCFGMPSVMSTWVRRQATHMLAGFGSIVVPHSQHKILPCTFSRDTSARTSMG